MSQEKGLLRPNWGRCQLAGMMCSRSKKSRGRRAWTVREIHLKKTALVKMLHNRSKHLMVINEVEQPPPHPLKNLFVRITSICDLSNLNTDVTSQITAMTLFLLHDGSRVWGSFIFCFITLFNHFKDPATEWLQPCLLMIPYYQFYALKTCLSLHTSFFFFKSVDRKSPNLANSDGIFRRRPHHQHHASLQSSPQTSSTSKSAAYVTMRMI